MKRAFIIFLALFSSISMAETKLSVDVSIDKLTFQKPSKGVGKAGVLVFKSANVNNNGIVLNINNVNNYFDSQIFVRPTFLGFTTQFGSYGFALESNSALNTINQTELKNSKLILDDNQLNLSGEFFSFINPDSNVKLKTFRLYCQSATAAENNANTTTPTSDMIASCFNFLTLNGNYAPNNEAAALEYEGIDKGEKTFLQAQVKSFDLRKTQLSANLISAKSVSNNSYFINATNVNLNCAKDEDLKSLDFNKLKKTCLNRLKIAPLKASIVDKVSKSNFNLDIKDITVKDKLAYFALNNGALSDSTSTTYINNLLINCKKEVDTDLLDVFQVLRDCISYSRISIAEVKSTKPDQKDSSIQNIALSSSNGAMLAQAEAKLLGLKARISIYGTLALNEANKQISITVTDTKLPLGLNSVKLLMYFLKKNLISKDISIINNVITIQL
ncbi:MAG: hypothetical protein Q7U04_11595 [Bacteriovorax sp.]|nr:hypothetical protein [Bacteriovorax sp.]